MEMVDNLNGEVKSELAIPNVFQSSQARAELEPVKDNALLPSKIKASNGHSGNLAMKQRSTVSKHNVKADDDEDKDDCPLCSQEGRVFTAREGEMAKHFLEVHNILEQGYECTECGYKAKERNNLVEHINSTHRQPKFCCDLCDYQTPYSNRIKSHQVTTHKVGGLPCSSCAYIAPEIWVLGQHRRRMHNDLGDIGPKVRLKCDYCDYQANQNSHLRSHINALHQQIVFCCEMCSYQSKWKSSMLAHTRAKHMGLFIYCDHCKFKTVEKAVLKLHVKKKHGDIQFGCFSCSDKYITRVELKKHMSNVHCMESL